MEVLKRFELNSRGRDLVVGDIHGHFSRLRARLNEVGFDPRVDRLFSVGDMIDRGPESEQALEWLDEPWFHAVRGNHEDYAVRYRSVNRSNWSRYGGDWFLALDPKRQQHISERFAQLPLAMEVATAQGPVGILHADCPVPDWRRLDLRKRRMQDFCMWSRTRIQERRESRVHGLRALVVGHTPLDEPTTLGNVIHIDTGGWTEDGNFTLLDISTLRPLG